jgi:hypothetical protein
MFESYHDQGCVKPHWRMAVEESRTWGEPRPVASRSTSILRLPARLPHLSRRSPEASVAMPIGAGLGVPWPP